MSQPPSFVDSTNLFRVFHLMKTLYSLKHALRAWYKELKQFLLDYWFSNSQSDTSLFVYCGLSATVYFLVYVDDLLVTGSDPTLVSNFRIALSSQFSLKYLDTLHYFLGVEVTITSHGLLLTQNKYIQDLLTQFHMDGAKDIHTLLSTL